MDELIGSLKVHEQELMDEYKYVKGKIIALKDSEKTKTKHHSYALNSIVASDAKNNDDELSKENEKELAFLNRRLQRLLKRRKGPRRNFSRRDF